MDNKKNKADQTIDCSKLSCPLPVIKTRTAMVKMAVGEILEMIATDPGSVKDIEAWAKHTGQELLEVAREDGHFRFYIRKMK